MTLNKLSDNFVFKFLKYIKHGHLKLTNFNGEVFYFGNDKEDLKAEIKINKPGLTISIIKNGSVGLAESYMKGEFETNNLSNLIAILYEVKNTFGEQHTYIFKLQKTDQLIEHTCKKKFHVSPFIEMDCTYFFKITRPEEKILVYIDQYDNEDKLLVALQEGVKVNLNNKNLIKNYFFHPLMSFKIILAIHFEAFKLWIKGVKFIKKKIKIKNNITIES